MHCTSDLRWFLSRSPFSVEFKGNEYMQLLACHCFGLCGWVLQFATLVGMLVDRCLNDIATTEFRCATPSRLIIGDRFHEAVVLHRSLSTERLVWYVRSTVSHKRVFRHLIDAIITFQREHEPRPQQVRSRERHDRMVLLALVFMVAECVRRVDANERILGRRR